MELASQLSQLETAQLIRRLLEDEWAYMFKHTLTQETVYQSVLRQRRREIHACVAQTYEELYANRLDEFATVLAQHYAEAGNANKTFEYSVRAGDVAARVYANVEAIMHYDRAVEIAKRVEINIDALKQLYLKRGRVFELCGHYNAAQMDYDEMEAYAREHHNPEMELAGILARATLYTIPTPLQNLAQGKELLDRALTLARELNDHAAEAKTLWNLMLAEYFFGQQARSIEFGEQALRVARQFDLREQLAYILNDIGRSYIGVGRIDDASTALEQARELWQAQGNLPMLVDNLGTAEENAMLAGDYFQAKAFANQALRISQSMENLWNQAYVLMSLSIVSLDEGDFRSAIDTMEETIRLGNQTGFVAATWYARVNLAFTFGELGVPERGIALYEPYMDDVLSVDNAFKPWGVGVAAYLYFQLGREAESKKLGAMAGRHANRDDLVNMAPIILTLLEGEWAMRQNEFESAERIAKKLLDRYHETGLHIFKSDILLLAAKTLHRQGKIEEARTMLTQARKEAENVGVRRVLWKILAEWSALESELDNVNQAQALHDQAHEILEFIIAHTPPEFRESFLDLPNVRSVMES